MINIEADFNFDELEKDMEDKLQVWFNELAEKLMETGKASIDYAINKVTSGGYGKIFENITYNLRSSMGCGLVVNGQVTETYFPFGANDEGEAHGRALLEKIALEVTGDIELIVVAGSFYAYYVESKGFDVLRMSNATFEKEFLQLLNSK